VNGKVDKKRTTELSPSGLLYCGFITIIPHQNHIEYSKNCRFYLQNQEQQYVKRNLYKDKPQKNKIFVLVNYQSFYSSLFFSVNP